MSSTLKKDPIIYLKKKRETRIKINTFDQLIIALYCLFTFVTFNAMFNLNLHCARQGCNIIALEF